MRLLRFLLIILPILFGLALGAAWVVPDMMDWDPYRGTIESLASAALGRQVRIEGPITLELLPEPVLTAAAVHIDAQSGVEISAGDLRLAIAPAALLRGNIDARELVLHDPVMRLPWPLPPGTFAFHRPPWLAALTARIEGGRLTIGAVTFTGIDATLFAGDASGGYRLAGTARREVAGSARSEGDWRFTARLTGTGRDGTAGLDVSLDGTGNRQGLGMRFSGQLDANGMLAGGLDAQGPDLARVLPAPAVPFRASGRLTLASGLLAADDLALDIGGSPARGAVALRLLPHPRLDLAVAAGRLDLDAWVPALLHAPPAGYPVGVDLSAEAALLSGGLLRRLRVAFDVAAAEDPATPGSPGGIVLREARAILPGDASLTLSGTLPRSDAARPNTIGGFSGQASLSAPDFRTTLHWLEQTAFRPFSDLPAGVLSKLDLSATITADTTRVAFGAIHGQIDGEAVDGGLTLTLGPRLSLVGEVTSNRLRLDPWVPSSWPNLVDLPATLPPFDVALRVSAQHVAFRGADFSPVLADFALDEGHLRLHRLEAAVQGMAIRLSGTIGEGGRVSDGQFKLTAKDATALLPVLPAWLNIPPLWQTNAKLMLEASGPPNALALKINADLGDLRIEAQPVLDVVQGKSAGPLTLRHPGAPRLLETLGLLGAPAWLGDGSFSLVAGLSATPRQIKADKLDVVAGSFRASGQLLLAMGDDQVPALSGQINAETLPLPEIYPRGLDPLPLRWLSHVRAHVAVSAAQVLVGLAPELAAAQGSVSVSDGVVKLEGLKAKFSGGELTGSAAFDVGAHPPTLQLDAELNGATVNDTLKDGEATAPLDLTAGTLDAAVKLTAMGNSPAALLATLAGAVHLSVADGAMRGFDLSAVSDGLRHGATDSALIGSVTTGVTPFTRLTAAAAVANGRATLQGGHMQTDNGAADFSGAVDLAGSALDLMVTLAPNVPASPHLGVRLSGPFEAVRRIPLLAELAGWRAAGAP